MSKRGPKPTPTPILRLRGSWRGKQRIEPHNLDQKRPPCPKRFITKQKTADGEIVRVAARRTWERFAPELHRAGLLTSKDAMMWEMTCDSYGRWTLACQKCDADGMVTKGANENDVQSPWVRIRNEMWAQVCKGAACFGLSPADIAGVRAMQKPTTDDGKARFFKEA